MSDIRDLIPNGIKDVIEAFADGESVAPEALAAALATAEGREHLIDTLRLRGLVAGRAPAMTIGGAPSRRAGRSRTGWYAAAAAIIAGVCVFGGYRAGRSVTPAAPAVAASTPSSGDTAAAPAPTTVIKLDAANGWRDRSGGF